MKITRRQLRKIIREAAQAGSLPFELQSSPADLKPIFEMIETAQMENLKSAIELFNMLEGTDVEVWDGERAQEALETSGHSGAFRVEIPGGDFVENVSGWTTPRHHHPPEYVHPFTIAMADYGYAVDEYLWRGLDYGWIYL